MASVVGDIAIQIGADIAPLVTGLGRGQTAIDKFGDSARASAGIGAGSFARAGVIMGAAAAAAGIALVALTKNSMDNIDALSKSARTLGIQTASLQAMAMVADESGVSSEELTKSLIKMQNAIVGLGDRTAAQVTAFGKLGISMADLQGLGADAQFALIAESIGGILDPAQRTAAALDIFGKTGAGLIPMFDGYGAAVKNAADYQRDFNIAVGTEQGNAVEAANDAVGRLTGSVVGLGNSFAVAFAPMITEAVEFLTGSMMGLALIFREVNDLLNTTTEKTNSAAQAILLEEIRENAAAASAKVRTLATAWDRVVDPLITEALRAHADDLDSATASLEAGVMPAEMYGKAVSEAMAGIGETLARIEKLNKVNMSTAIGWMDGYKDAILRSVGGLERLIGLQAAVNFNASAESSAGAGSSASGEADVRVGLGPVTSTRPKQRSIDAGPDIDVSGGGVGGVGGGGDSLADQLEALQERLASEADIQNTAYLDAQLLLEESLARKLLTNEEYQATLEALQAEHQGRMSQIDAGAYGNALQKTGAYFGVLADTFQAGNEKMQKIGRVFGAAEALVNAWRGYAQVMGDPTVPFFAKFAAGAAVLAAGMGAVQAIKSGSSSRGGGGGGAGAGASAGSSGGAAGGSAQTATQISLQLVGGDLYSRDQVLQLINAINSATADGAQILLR